MPQVYQLVKKKTNFLGDKPWYVAQDLLGRQTIFLDASPVLLSMYNITC